MSLMTVWKRNSVLIEASNDDNDDAKVSINYSTHNKEAHSVVGTDY